jgi:hypothetical protein
MENSILSNCFLQSIYYRCKIKGSKIVAYYNPKYKVISFYVKVEGKYDLKFSRDKSKPVIIKNVLFYTRHNIKFYKSF